METLDIVTIITCVVTVIFLILWIWCAAVQQGLLVKIYNDLQAIIDSYTPPAPPQDSRLLLNGNRTQRVRVPPVMVSENLLELESKLKRLLVLAEKNNADANTVTQ